MDGVEGRRQVDGDDRVPLGGREFVDRRDMLDAGIVDEDVDAAKLRRLRDHGGDLVRLRHVRRRIERATAAEGLKPPTLGLDRLGVAEPVDDDIGAFAGQRPGDGKADAGGRSGDEGGAGFQEHGIILSFPA